MNTASPSVQQQYLERTQQILFHHSTGDLRADQIVFQNVTVASEIINNAITRTMSRTIITHGCTQLMVTSILIFGGETLHYFALALTIGILFGIYSSVLVASPLVMWLGVTREDFIRPEKKKEEAVV